MKKIILILAVLSVCLPAAAQKLSKAEKAAQAKEAYDKAVECVNKKSFVIVPSSYTDTEGLIQSNTDNSNFISCEIENLFMQGRIVCDNNYTNIAQATEYTPNFDKKGNLRLRIVVNGRMIKGTYVISMRSNSNMADVVFTPQSGTVRKFSGPLTPLGATKYNKRANAI